MEQQNIASGGVQCIPQIADVYLATVSVSQSENAVNDDSDLLYEILNNNGTDLSINTEAATQYYIYRHYNNTYTGELTSSLHLFRNSVTLNSVANSNISSDRHYYYYSDATNTTVNSGGSMYISSGGVANNTTVNSSGYMGIDGGVANNNTVNSGGWMRILGGVANSTTVNGGNMCLYYGGCVANSTTVNGGAMYIDGGVANSTTVNSRGSMHIYAGGTATAIKENGGYVYVADGANVTFVSNTFTGLTLSGGTATVHSNTVANNTTVNFSGYMDIDGGIANNTTVNFSGYMDIDGGIANSTTVNSRGDMRIYGGIANSTTVNSRGDMRIYGGVANSTTVNSSGYMGIYGGVATNTTVNSRGSMNIYSGGEAIAIKENGGYVYVADGANVTFVSNTITGLTLNYQSMTVHSNTVANSTTLNSRGWMYIYSGGVANITTLNSRGWMYISSGGVANSTTVNSGGSMYISSGGVANSTTVNSSGYMGIYGGVANSTTVNSGGDMTILYGGVANGTTVNGGGGMGIWYGCVANSTTVNSRGWMNIYSGGVANSTTVNNRGRMYISSGGEAIAIKENGGYVYVADGANVTFVSNTFTGLTLSGGTATVHSNTVANCTTLNSWGYMYIYSGGVANSTTVNSGGSMYISSGGVAKGGLDISEGAYVDAFNGAIIDFTIANEVPDNDYIVNNLSLINGTPTYTLTYDEKQVAGTYLLAANASTFNKTITIKSEDGTSHGALTLDMDEALEVGDISFLLKLDDKTGVLSVEVNSEYSKRADREKQATQAQLPDTAFSNLSYNNYALTQAPDWLKIDPNTGKFSGTTGKITDTATGYGTTEVIITATKNGESKEHTMDLVVVPEKIEGDTSLDGASTMTDAIAESITKSLQSDTTEISIEKIKWKYAGADIEISDVNAVVDIGESEYEMKLQGTLGFSFLSSGEDASLKADFTKEKYISVKTPKDFKDVEFEVVGDIEFENISIANGFALKKGKLEVDTTKNTWSGEAEVGFTHLDDTVACEFKVVDQKLDTLKVEVSGLRIALGTTGFFADEFRCGVENITSTSEPTTMSGGFGFYYGAQVNIGGNSYSLAEIDLDGTMTYDSMAGEATVKILGGLVTGKAGISIDWKTDCLEGHGNLSVANLATISAGFKINSSGSFMVQGTQSVDLTKYGLGVAYNSNVMVQYIKDNTSTNDYYAVWATQEFFGQTFSVGVKFDYNGNWIIVNGSEINSELKDYASERSAASQCSWQINGNGETVLLTVNTTSPDLCVLTDGNGKVYYGIDSISANAGKEFELVSSTDSGVTIAVKASKAGTWSLESFDASATYTGIVLGGSESLAAKNAAATLSNDRTVVIDCGVPESGTVVSIYCDNDASGYDGEFIGNVDSTGKLTWKITNPDAATYSFYAVSSSDNALPVMGKYSNAITVDAIETQVEASDGWTYVGENQYISGASISGVLEVEGGSVRNGLTLEHGAELIGSDATLSGKLIFGGDVTLRTLCETDNAEVVFDLTERSFKDDFIVNNKQYLNGIKGYSITVSSDQKCGTYKLMSNAADVSGTMSLNNESVTLRTLTVNGKPQEINGRLYELTQVNGELMLSVQEKAVVKVADTNLLSNGVSQILAWDSEQGKVGYMATDGSVRPAWKGVWEWSGAEADLWRVAGVGHFKGSEVDYDGVLLYNGVGNRFAAWTDLRKGSYGYVNLCKVDGSFNTQCLANLDGDQYDDILIYDTNGSIGVVLGGTTYKDIFHVNEGDFATWTIEGAGSFDDGMDKLVMVNNYNHQVYLWTNQDTTFATWNWKTQSVGKLESGWEVAAVGDFEGDGIDDIMVLDRNTNNVWIWDDGNSQTKRWRGTLGEGFEIEASGDYNGDGCADLLLREYNSGWGGMGYWGNGYAGNWVDLKARIETDLKSSFDIIA